MTATLLLDSGDKRVEVVSSGPLLQIRATYLPYDGEVSMDKITLSLEEAQALYVCLRERFGN